ncbi:uncharacterized protein N7459_001165 [Penicillium hispanicum]|uniref:uncharacterized protein n=1 Tax=Penicillium hispanicum TaxID=1080232 RepID=UPI002540F8B4|nr:uncharacterized protein N7459_001165 [Penicillium hispanicum]KAJ5594957.1 hypothetical protein N7459_001165 [Penicillium hispanicum]
MPVTEIAQFRYKAGNPSATESILLQQAQQAQSEYSNHPAHLLRQVEDSSYGYILGGWESVAVHTEDWIRSETNQKVMAGLQDGIDVEWMFHLDIDPSTSSAPFKAPVVSITRCFVEPSKKAGFENFLKAGLPQLAGYEALVAYAGGWRIDKEGEDEEYVLFGGWSKVEDHLGFAGSEASSEFSKIRDFVKGAEAKHMVVEKWQ